MHLVSFIFPEETFLLVWHRFFNSFFQLICLIERILFAETPEKAFKLQSLQPCLLSTLPGLWGLTLNRNVLLMSNLFLVHTPCRSVLYFYCPIFSGDGHFSTLPKYRKMAHPGNPGCCLLILFIFFNILD